MNKPKISLIAAISRENRGLGYEGKIQWHIPADWVRFKELTAKHVTIMGRKTIESMGKALPDRVNIVVTRDPNYTYEGAITATSIEKAIEKAEELLQILETENLIKDEIFVIGGGEIFSLALDRADKIYLTLVDGEYKADAFFPEYSQFARKVYDKKEESNGYSYEYMDLERD